MQIETNGAVTPEDAVALAARILQDQLQLFINFDEPQQIRSEEPRDDLPFNRNLLRKVHEAKEAGAAAVEVWGTGKPRRASPAASSCSQRAWTTSRRCASRTSYSAWSRAPSPAPTGSG